MIFLAYIFGVVVCLIYGWTTVSKSKFVYFIISIMPILNFLLAVLITVDYISTFIEKRKRNE